MCLSRPLADDGFTMMFAFCVLAFLRGDLCRASTKLAFYFCAWRLISMNVLPKSLHPPASQPPTPSFCLIGDVFPLGDFRVAEHGGFWISGLRHWRGHIRDLEELHMLWVVLFIEKSPRNCLSLSAGFDVCCFALSIEQVIMPLLNARRR